MVKQETVAEFLARGGKITVIPSVFKDKEQTVHSTTGGPAVIFSLEDADALFGEKAKGQQKLTTKSSKSTIDINLIPPHLRKKFIDPLLEEENV